MRVLALCVLAAGVLRAEPLPLTTDAAGNVTFGDARLQVSFEQGTGVPCAVRVDGTPVLEKDPSFSDVCIEGVEGGWPAHARQDLARDLVRTDDGTVCLKSGFGAWRLEQFFQLRPEARALRRWFAFTWTGTNRVTFGNIRFSQGRFPCADGKGAYILPGRFPQSRHPQSTWREGTWNPAVWLSESILAADNGRGRSVLMAVDCLRDYSDRGENIAIERTDGLSLQTRGTMTGYARPGVRQLVGDYWLTFRKGDAEEALRRAHDWHRLAGCLPPADRPDWVRGLVLYSTHPCGRGMSDPGGFPQATAYLPYVKTLGANAVWLRPVEHRSCYVPDEMYRLQDLVGTEADHLAYVRDAHRRGIRVWRDAVMHGGHSDNRRSREHPEWLCYRRDGTVQASYWAYDFAWPSWVDYFAKWVGWTTRTFELDGWRMDVPTGSRFPNWNPEVPYARASYANHQGGLRQMRAIRAAARAVNPDSCTLAEANGSYCSVTCDAIYDQMLCHAYFHWFNSHPAEETVRALAQWLADQRNAYVPGTVWMRYPESHDAYPCDHVWGRAGATALMALSAWIEGFPLVMNESEDGAFEAYRAIFATRRALPELVRGVPQYVGVPAPKGVFACRRTLPEGESVFYVNFNGHRVDDLPPFGYKVVRTRGASVADAVKDLPPLETPCGNGRTTVTAELRDLTNGLVKASCRIAVERTAEGTRYRVTDLAGFDPARVRLVVRLPDVGRWYAHAAEGSFESPFVVRHPGIDAHDRFGERFDGAVRWDSAYHPFGFTRDHAEVGGVREGRAYACHDFGPGARVCLWDRLGNERGLAVSVAGTNLAALCVSTSERAAAAASAPHDAGTGDPRLTVTMGGWQYESGDLRVRIRRTGAIAGVWRKDVAGTWREKVRTFGLRARKPDAPKVPRRVWGGADPDAREQAYSPFPKAWFVRDADGSLRLHFEGGDVRGIEQNSGTMPQPVRSETDYAFDGSDAGFGFALTLVSRGRCGPKDWTVEMRAELPSGGDAAALGVPTFDGWRPVRITREGDAVRYVYHEPDGPDFAPPRNWRHTLRTRIR